MGNAIHYYAKKLASLKKKPKDCTKAELKKIIDTHGKYLDSLCNEDGHVYTYERHSKSVSPWFTEAEKRGVK